MGKKSQAGIRPAKKARSKPSSKPTKPFRPSRPKSAPKGKAPARKPARRVVSRKTAKKKQKPAARSTQKKKAPARAPAKPSVKNAVAPPSPPPRLLRPTKTTASALALMEKGIQYIYQKEFKKARSELKNLLETYSSEKEILARARSYLQICDREEAAQKKPPVTTDQLYTMGILEHNKANYEKAISYFMKSLENRRDADYIYYSLAASLAMKGDLAGAMDNLRKAVDLNGDSRVYAKNDPDFAALQSKKEFAELVGMGPALSSE